MDDEKLSAETLSGDIRDMILTHIRAMEMPWSKLSEKDQQTKIFAATSAAERMVRGAIRTVATQGFPHILATVGKWTVKDGVKLELIANSSVDNITKLAEHGSSSAVLVLAEASVFFGERKPAAADKDQPDLPIDDDSGEWADMPGELDESHDPETGELDPPGDMNEVHVTKDGKRTRVTVDELQAELKAGKVKVHGIGNVEMTA